MWEFDAHSPLQILATPHDRIQEEPTTAMKATSAAAAAPIWNAETVTSPRLQSTDYAIILAVCSSPHQQTLPVKGPITPPASLSVAPARVTTVGGAAIDWRGRAAPAAVPANYAALKCPARVRPATGQSNSFAQVCVRANAPWVPLCVWPLGSLCSCGQRQ